MMDETLTPPDSGPPRLPPGRRVYAVGDVHGHAGRLRAIHDAIRADLRERPVADPFLIHLGDVIDRGPDSAGCLDLLAIAPLPGLPTACLLGNHEWMMMRALEGGAEDVDRWLDNGGDTTLRSWGLRSTQKPADWLAGIPARHLALVGGMALSWRAGGYVFVHAGVRPGTPMASQRQVDLLWIRDSFLHWNGVMLPEAPATLIVHGHTPGPAVVVRPNRIGIDTGAGAGGTVSCLVLEGAGLGLIAR